MVELHSSTCAIELVDYSLVVFAVDASMFAACSFVAEERPVVFVVVAAAVAVAAAEVVVVAVVALNNN